jgi:hypothetical protein
VAKGSDDELPRCRFLNYVIAVIAPRTSIAIGKSE